MRTSLAALTVLLAMFASGYTSCQHWTTTTVPATDNTAPLATPSVIIGSGPQVNGNGTLEREVPDLDTPFIAIPAAWDYRGIQTLESSAFAEVTCHSGLGYSIHFIQQTESQNGSTGDTVSQGIYFLDDMRFSDFDHLCRFGGGIETARYHFSIFACDFRGNTVSGWGEITYGF